LIVFHFKTSKLIYIFLIWAWMWWSIRSCGG